MRDSDMASADVPTTEAASSATSKSPTKIPDDWLPLTAAGVDRIVAVEDPALRNLWITQSYADLGARLLATLETDQSWCSFATWASNTAGLSIRDAELPHVLNSLFRDTAEHLDAIARGINEHPPIIRWLGLARLGIVRTVHRSALGHLVERALVQVSGFIAAGATRGGSRRRVIGPRERCRRHGSWLAIQFAPHSVADQRDDAVADTQVR